MLYQPCFSSQVCSPTQFCLSSSCFPRTLLPLAAHELLSGLLLFVLAGLAAASGLTTMGISGLVLLFLNGFGVKQTVPMLQLLTVGVAGAGLGGSQWQAGEYRTGLQRWVFMLLGNYYGVRVFAALPDAAILALVALGMAFGGCELSKRAQLTECNSQDLRNALHARPTKVRRTYSRLHSLPLKRLFLPFCMLLATVCTIFLLGGPALPSFASIQPCSDLFWTVTAIYTAFGVLLAVFGQYIDKQMALLSKSDCLGAVLTGFCSGIAGLSSEIYIAPVLFTVSAQTEPRPQALPASLLVCASTAFLHYAVQGSVAYTFALWQAVWAVCGAFTGVLLREKLRGSACLRLLALLHAVAAGLVPLYAVLLVLQLLRTGLSPISLLPLC